MNQWREVTFEEIFDISSSKRVLQKDWKSFGIPFYRAREIVKLAQEGAVKNDLFISEDLYKSYLSKYIVPQAGDLMVSAVGTLGACYLVQPKDRFYYKDASVLRFSPKQELCSRFILHAFRTPEIINQIQASSGSTVGTYTIQRANKTLLKLPPLPEQIRIANILDQADALRVKRREALAQLDSLRHAIFIEMFGHPDNNPKNWLVKKLGEFCSFVNGGTPSKEVSDYFNGEIPWISSADIADSKIQNVRHFITEMGIIKSSTNVVAADTILLVTRTGVGKVVITDMELCFSQDITALIPNINIINKIYLTFYLKVKESYFQSMARGATIKGITRNVIESLKVPLPPLELQNNFAVRIRAIEMIRESQKKSEFEFDSLFTSLQHHAFRGEL